MNKNTEILQNPIATDASREYTFGNAIFKVNSFYLQEGRTLESTMEKLILNQAKKDVA